MRNTIAKPDKGPGIISLQKAIWMLLCIFSGAYALNSILIERADYLSLIFGSALAFGAGKLYTRSMIFHFIDDNKIELRWKSKKAVILISDVKSISKITRFSNGGHFLWILKVKSGKFNLLNFYIFPNVEEYNLKDQFESVGIPLKSTMKNK